LLCIYTYIFSTWQNKLVKNTWYGNYNLLIKISPVPENCLRHIALNSHVHARSRFELARFYCIYKYIFCSQKSRLGEFNQDAFSQRAMCVKGKRFYAPFPVCCHAMASPCIHCVVQGHENMAFDSVYISLRGQTHSHWVNIEHAWCYRTVRRLSVCRFLSHAVFWFSSHASIAFRIRLKAWLHKWKARGLDMYMYVCDLLFFGKRRSCERQGDRMSHGTNIMTIRTAANAKPIDFSNEAF
jgi:hypothetical protein